MSSLNNNLPRPKRILIIKPSALGDVVTAVAVLRGLRRSFGDEITIDWLINKNCAAAIAEDLQLSEAIIFDRKKFSYFWLRPSVFKQFRAFCRDLNSRNYDWVIDLQGLLRSGFLSLVTGADMRAGFANAREFAHIAYTHKLPAAETPIHTVDKNIALAKMLGVDAREEDFFTFEVPPLAKPWLENFIDENGSDYIVVCPATRWQSKLYPQKNWAAVINELAKSKKVVLTAAPGEEHLTRELNSIPNTIDFTGKTSIAELIALISAASCVISCDSASMHMAAALNVPQVTLIGPTNQARTGPYRRDSAVLTSQMECIGCLKRKCNNNQCMEQIDPQSVIRKVKQLIIQN